MLLIGPIQPATEIIQYGLAKNNRQEKLKEAGHTHFDWTNVALVRKMKEQGCQEPMTSHCECQSH